MLLNETGGGGGGGTSRLIIISLLRFIGFVFVLCLFLCLFLFCILTKLCPSSRSTVAQQFFWSPFIVFCRFGYSSVSFSVLIVSVKMESIEMSLNKCRLVNIFNVQNFYL